MLTRFRIEFEVIIFKALLLFDMRGDRLSLSFKLRIFSLNTFLS